MPALYIWMALFRFSALWELDWSQSGMQERFIRLNPEECVLAGIFILVSWLSGFSAFPRSPWVARRYFRAGSISNMFNSRYHCLRVACYVRLSALRLAHTPEKNLLNLRCLVHVLRECSWHWCWDHEWSERLDDIEYRIMSLRNCIFCSVFCPWKRINPMNTASVWSSLVGA